MIDKTNNTNDNCLCYRSPKVNVIELKVQNMLCGSLDGSPITNEYNRGSESYVGFGDDEDD